MAKSAKVEIRVMATLEELLNTVKLPDFDVLFLGESPDYESLERAARAVFGGEDVSVKEAAIHRIYSHVRRVELEVDGEQKAMYIKRERWDSRAAATQMELGNLLSDASFRYAIGFCPGETSLILTEEAPGDKPSSKSGYDKLLASDEFAWAYGLWLERSLALSLRDRDWRNIHWDGSRLTDYDYGYDFGELVQYPPDRWYGDLYRDSPRNAELMEEARQEMREQMSRNISSNADAVRGLCLAWEESGVSEGLVFKSGPREILLHYTSTLEDRTFRKLFKDILAK